DETEDEPENGYGDDDDRAPADVDLEAGFDAARKLSCVDSQRALDGAGPMEVALELVGCGRDLAGPDVLRGREDEAGGRGAFVLRCLTDLFDRDVREPGPSRRLSKLELGRVVFGLAEPDECGQRALGDERAWSPQLRRRHDHRRRQQDLLK